jgi:hypothetical protein
VTRNLLDAVQWKAIRDSWEYDPGEPTFAQAGAMAAAKFGFVAPGKTTIESRQKKEGWERKANLSGINAAAQRKADRLRPSDASDAPSDGASDASGTKKAPHDAAASQSARAEAEDLRAGVIARHRQEWIQVAGLRQEALLLRKTKDKPDGSVEEAFAAAKLAKITAEMTGIQQAGERKAWGLDVVVNPDDLKNLSDAALQDIAEGRAPRR